MEATTTQDRPGGFLGACRLQTAAYKAAPSIVESITIRYDELLSAHLFEIRTDTPKASKSDQHPTTNRYQPITLFSRRSVSLYTSTNPFANSNGLEVRSLTVPKCRSTHTARAHPLHISKSGLSDLNCGVGGSLIIGWKSSG